MRRLTSPFFSIAMVLMMIAAGRAVTAAQAPTAAIRGTITDAAEAVVPGALVSARNKETGAERSVKAGANGQYQVENLEPGAYEIKVTMNGFKTEVRTLTLQIGDNATVNFALQVGQASETVNVTGETPQLNTTDYKVDGSVNRAQIENLPLNGRNFLELSALEPGVSVTSFANPGALGNNFVRVSVAGAIFNQTRISVDGGTVNERITGGTGQNFSQESVQEFQISTFSFDLANSTTGVGSVNIVSRRGGNALRGTGFFYYRDHNMAAFPGFGRSASNPDPFFARRQSGFSLGGPFKKDRLFWFTNYEHNNQDGVFDVRNNNPIFSRFDRIHPSPLNFNLFNLRLDGQLTQKHNGYLRFSLDKNSSFAPPAAATFMPSNWQSSRNRSTQTQIGLTSVLTAKLVNDLRASYLFLKSYLTPPAPEDCPGPPNLEACIGLGGPQIAIFDAAQFRIGNQNAVPTSRFPRTFQLTDNVTWQRGEHRLRFGGEWEHLYFRASLTSVESAAITLWGVSNLQGQALRPIFDSLPASLRGASNSLPTLEEILQLPLRTFTTGVGNPGLPGPFNFDDASRNDRVRFYFQDAWRVRPRFTFNYGLAYSIETNLLNHDLDRPAYLAPLLGGDLSAPKRDTNNFNPAVGFAWTLDKNAKTVIRAGSGIYQDAGNINPRFQERAQVGPSGNGRYALDGSVAGINFISVPTNFRGRDLLPQLPALRGAIAARIGDGTNPSVRGIEITKQGGTIFDPDHTISYSAHVNVGIQRELARNLVLQADYVMRRFIHQGGLNQYYIIDRNRFNRPRVTGVNQQTGVVTFVRDSIIPPCTAAQSNALNPADKCSTGEINVAHSGANFRYQGLHVKLDKRFSTRLQFTASYALSRNTGFVEFTEFDNFASSQGLLDSNRRQRLTVSGVYNLPEYKGASGLLRGLFNTWSVSFISQHASAPPLTTILAGLDLDGDGLSRTLLPGTKHNQFGYGLGESRLRELVAQYNADVEAKTRRITNPDGTVTVVRPRTPFNQIINPITLPEAFSQGDSFHTQDLRVTRIIKLREDLRLNLIGEVFNLFNIANLTGYSGSINQPNFGQPSGRAGQVFGTGGPRAFQFAARLSF